MHNKSITKLILTEVINYECTAIGCHPDDIEISCCGVLAKCVKRGDKVTVCHVANGNIGHEIINHLVIKDGLLIPCERAFS